MGGRRFELVEGTSAKFWEIEARGAIVRVRLGRLGTEAQISEKALASASAAQSEVEKLVRETITSPTSTSKPDPEPVQRWMDLAVEAASV